MPAAASATAPATILLLDFMSLLCGRSAVAGRDDGRLDGVLGGVAREAGGDGALEELTLPADAVVAAGTEQQRTVHLHRRVASGQRAGERGGEPAGGGVAVLQGEVRGAVVLLPGADERVVHARVVGVVVGA